MTADDPNPHELRRLAVDMATAAGELLMDALAGERTAVETKSTGTDMVTEMDRASERFLVSRIIDARPDDAILGEEGADRPGTSGVRWVIDPLDGTTNYLYRLPGWNVSIGVEVDDAPVVGAVAVPSTGDLFTAAAGAGATRNGVPLVLSDPAPVATALVGTGFSYEPAVRTAQVANLQGVIGRIRDVRRSGAAATDLCGVACGRLDAYYESGLAHWDHCAGSVIAREAGARVELIDDHPLPGTLVVAAHPSRWDDFVTLLRDAGIVP